MRRMLLWRRFSRYGEPNGCRSHGLNFRRSWKHTADYVPLLRWTLPSGLDGEDRELGFQSLFTCARALCCANLSGDSSLLRLVIRCRDTAGDRHGWISFLSRDCFYDGFSDEPHHARFPLMIFRLWFILKWRLLLREKYALTNRFLEIIPGGCLQRGFGKLCEARVLLWLSYVGGLSAFVS